MDAEIKIKFIPYYNPGILIVTIIGGLNGLMNEAPQVNKNSTPITLFLIFFMEVFWLLVADTNKYCKQYLATLHSDSGCWSLLHITVQMVYAILYIIWQMVHDVRDTLKHYWPNLEQFYMPIYSNTVKGTESLGCGDIIVQSLSTLRFLALQ